MIKMRQIEIESESEIC